MKKSIAAFLLLSLSLITVAHAVTPTFIKFHGKVYSPTSLDSSFVFGASTLGDSDDYMRMFFNKSNGSFGATSKNMVWEAPTTGSASVDLGSSNIVSGTSSFGIGYGNYVTGSGSFGIGYFNYNPSNNSITIGNYLENSASKAIAIGSAVCGGCVPMTVSTPNSLIAGAGGDNPTLYISSASGTNTSGRVGIANTNPDSRVILDVNGVMKLPVVTSFPTCDSSFAGTVVFADPINNFAACTCHSGFCNWTTWGIPEYPEIFADPEA